ncbi:glycosyltransferase [Microbacterium sp. NPDC077663]|uniref:glycosyltransferase n=1 Tax=Microbacterium sp. NPDC077663 TaxID=3364189 RepID=UPI0037CA2558
MTADPDISLVVPLFNAAPWIEECLRSLLGQTGLDLEVVCVDDGSTDGSATLAGRMRDEDSRITLIHQANAGQSAARNRGMDAARGRYIAFVDSDDYWISDVAATLVAQADADRLNVLLFDGRAELDGEVDPSLWSWYSGYYARKKSYRRVLGGAQLAARMRRKGDYKPHVGLYLTNRDFLAEVGPRFIPGIVHQDNPFTFRLLLSAQRAAHTATDAYARRLRPGSTITTLQAKRSIEGYLTAHEDMRDALDAHDTPLSGRDRRALRAIVDSTLRGAQKQLATLDDDDRAQFLTDLDARGISRRRPGDGPF